MNLPQVYNSSMNWGNISKQVIPVILAALLLTTSVNRLDNPVDKARLFTDHLEYDYIAWTAGAVAKKTAQAELNAEQRIAPDKQEEVVLRYFDLVRDLEITQAHIQVIYTDPKVKDPDIAAVDLLRKQASLESSLNMLAPLVESIIQYQVSQVIDSEGIGFLSQPLPPVLFHASPLPKALIVSPRNVIQQDVNISLLADLSLEEINTLENEISSYMDESVLIVDVGGIGVYPTMIQRVSSLQWTVDTVSHEWTHNYLTLHPLGLNYEKTPELRTMNETTASIVGTELSAELMKRFYPQLSYEAPKVAMSPAKADTFDFRAEMHTTRVTVDALLAEGKITEAETYMNQRREVFVAHGYMIRKLNQAYFAFYGAYADIPGGAAGEDPVGPAVRALRAQSSSLRQFLVQIARMNSFAELQQAVKKK